MSVLVAVPDSADGTAALTAAVEEARMLRTDLVVVNIGLHPLDGSELPTDVPVTVVDRSGRGDRDPVVAVLDEIDGREVQRLVIGIRRRTPVGKAVFGSVSQRLLLESPVPVLAVKTPA
ncbi:universal stress protein [Kineococcus gynurae]|uniref:Universal stress protein n=1 Tax=Kineococcus gynurae TaxID=452979 RepID=A0ABV5LPA7_9ACTN